MEQQPLRPDHAWRARPGCKIFVAERGALRFDYPEAWVVQPDGNTICFFDREPPDDDSRLTVSMMRLPPLDWSGLRIDAMLADAVPGGGRDGVPGPIHVTRRGDLELAWRELRFVDDESPRDAYTRTCIARSGEWQGLLTFDFWVDDVDRCDTAWQIVLDTLELGRIVADPTRGPVVS